MLTWYSDGPTPEAVTEHILNIYPIVQGQTFSQVNAIPPHNPVASSHNGASASAEPVNDAPAEQNAGAAGTAQPDGPLIDLVGATK